jgi:hypothetical protein
MKKKQDHINAIATPANVILTVIFALASLAAIVPLLIVLGLLLPTTHMYCSTATVLFRAPFPRGLTASRSKIR